MRWFNTDLHIHSVLSPCGSLEMSPQNLIKVAKLKKLDIIALTDHNSLANSEVYRKISEKYRIKMIFGIEVQSSEEVHFITLFDSFSDAEAFNTELYASLQEIENDPEYFGDQVVIDENENIIKFEKKALINSSSWDYRKVFEKVEKYHGFCFPAHIDAFHFSILKKFGKIPDHKSLIALEISAKCKQDEIIKEYPFLKNYTLLRNSDAHYLCSVGLGTTRYFIKEASVQEIKKACLGLDGRKVDINFPIHMDKRAV